MSKSAALNISPAPTVSIAVVVGAETLNQGPRGCRTANPSLPRLLFEPVRHLHWQGMAENQLQSIRAQQPDVLQKIRRSNIRGEPRPI